MTKPADIPRWMGELSRGLTSRGGAIGNHRMLRWEESIFSVEELPERLFINMGRHEPTKWTQCNMSVYVYVYVYMYVYLSMYVYVTIITIIKEEDRKLRSGGDVEEVGGGLGEME